mmetsp:Transcript_43624/g.100609  ORF Transcript_43624/g.100609 Transcript_43624/m.100609 type:complete len:96 (+) Transcript_43624:226-513(+)
MQTSALCTDTITIITIIITMQIGATQLQLLIQRVYGSLQSRHTRRHQALGVRSTRNMIEKAKSATCITTLTLQKEWYRLECAGCSTLPVSQELQT